VRRWDFPELSGTVRSFEGYIGREWESERVQE
jgi:hypothetical protein